MWNFAKFREFRDSGPLTRTIITFSKTFRCRREKCGISRNFGTTNNENHYLVHGLKKPRRRVICQIFSFSIFIFYFLFFYFSDCNIGIFGHPCSGHNLGQSFPTTTTTIPYHTNFCSSHDCLSTVILSGLISEISLSSLDIIKLN